MRNFSLRISHSKKTLRIIHNYFYSLFTKKEKCTVGAGKMNILEDSPKNVKENNNFNKSSRDSKL